jgi:hypothetical protein
VSRDYTWTRRSIQDDMFSVGDLALWLGLGRHQARRVLLHSGLPCRLITRHWWDPRTGRGYTRKALCTHWRVGLVLLLRRIKRDLEPDAKRLGIPTPPALDSKISELLGSLSFPTR